MMIGAVLRRLLGIFIILFGIIYAYGRWNEYEIEGFDIPGFMHTPAFWMGALVVTVWCWVPIMQPVSPRHVSMSQEVPRQFSNPGEMQNEPFQMNGQWFIIWNGDYMVWSDEAQQWMPYRG